MKGQKDQKLQKDKTNKAAASALFKNIFDWKETTERLKLYFGIKP